MGNLVLRTGSEIFDIEAREMQVARGGQRIQALPEQEFTEEARELADAVRSNFKIKDAANVPDMFAVMFKHPGVYRGQMQLGLELNKFGVLPPRERELAILRVAWMRPSTFRASRICSKPALRSPIW